MLGRILNEVDPYPDCRCITAAIIADARTLLKGFSSVPKASLA